MRKTLKIFYIIQKSGNKSRINPFNPLSYIFVILSIIIGIILFGIVGFWDHVDNKNPFKY